MLDSARPRVSTSSLVAAGLVLMLALVPVPGAAQLVMTGAGQGGGPHVRLLDTSLFEFASFYAYDPAFPGGVRVALGDVSGDGIPDLVTGAGPGGGPHVKVFHGVTNLEILSFYAYDPAFTGGVYVAVGDVTGDGRMDIITGAGAGGGPHVKVFDGQTGAEITGFFAYDPAFAGGVTVATGYINGDGIADIITGAGPGGGPHVKVFNGATGTEIRGFYAYDPAFLGGVFVAAADVDDDGVSDIITGAGPGGGPHVKVFDGASGAEVRGFFAYDPAFLGGVRVAAGDVNGDGLADIITAAGPGGGPHVRVFDAATDLEVAGFFAYDPAFPGGVFVAVDSTVGFVGSTETTTVLQAIPNPSVTGQPVTFTATVTSASGVPTGFVRFQDGATVLGHVLLIAGVATHLELDLTTGTHVITAQYTGNPTFAPSTSNAVTQIVGKADTSVVVESSLNSSVFGQPVTFTATVSATPPGSGEPTGLLTFLVDGAPQATITLSSTQATFTTSALGGGSHTIAAQYLGDANFNGSTSPDLVQTVDKAATTTSLVSSQNPSGIGQSVTFTATVTSTAGTPAGPVQFFDGAAPLGGPIVLDGLGQASFTTSFPPPGPRSITAEYLGNADFLGSTSNLVLQDVLQVAVDDTFAATGNIAIQVGPPGVLGNDLAGALVTQFQPVSSLGGSVTVNPDGSFTYDPPVGVTGVSDTFTYEATALGATSSATVTIQIANDILWFVCDGCAGTNLGTLLNPFTSVGEFSAANTGPAPAPQPNHKIYIQSGTYDGSPDTLALRNGQQATGQGVAASDVLPTPVNAHPSYAALTAGARPTIAPTTGNGVTLAQDNTLRHFDVGAVGAGTKISGSNFGTLTANNMILSGAGQALDLATGTLAATLDSVSSSSGAANIVLSSVAGALTMAGGALSGAATRAIDIDGGTASVTYTGTITNGGSGIRVANKTGGTVALTGPAKTLTTGANPAVTLSNNTGATIDFTNGGLVIATTSGAGFSATDGGTVTVTGPNNTIDSIGGTALNIANTTIGASHVTFQRITSGTASNSAATGIILDHTGPSGGLRVTGTGTPGSGGTIQHKTGANGSTSTGIGIYLNTTSDARFAWMQLNDFQNFAIRGHAVTGFVLDNSVVNGTNGTSNAVADALVAGVQNGEDSIRLTDLFGVASITSTTMSGGFTDTLHVENTTGTLTRLTVDQSTITGRDAASANDAMNVLSNNGGTVMNVTVTNSTLTTGINKVFNAGARIDTTVDVAFRGNTVTNIATLANIVPGGGGVSFNGLGNMTYDISNNTFDFSNGGDGIKSIGVNVFKGGGSTGNFSGTIIDNTIGATGVPGSGSGPAASALNLDSQGTGISTVLIQGNSVFGYDEAGIRLNNVDGSSVLNAVVVGNTVAEPDTNAFAGLFVVAGADPTTDSGQVTNLQLGGGGANQNDFSEGDPNDLNDVFLQNSAGALNLSQGNSAGLTVTQVFNDNNTPPATTLFADATIAVETDDTVRLIVSPSNVLEDGATTATFTFLRWGNTQAALTVGFTVSSAATVGTDFTQSGADTFTNTTGTVTFAAGSPVATVTIDPTADATPEADEAVTLTAIAGDAAVADPSTATTTILDDD
jgi:hypothetical protein